MTSTARRAALGTLALGLLLSLGGCVPSAPALRGAELLVSAKSHYLRFRASIADVQRLLDRGAWESVTYGAVPVNWGHCPPSDHHYEMDRMGPIGVPPLIDAIELAEWMQEDGWEDIRVQDAATDSIAWVVTARKPDGRVADLTVLFYGYPAGVSVTAVSTCTLGDEHEVWALLTDPSGNLPDYPDAETPDDAPRYEWVD